MDKFNRELLIFVLPVILVAKLAVELLIHNVWLVIRLTIEER